MDYSAIASVAGSLDFGFNAATLSTKSPAEQRKAVAGQFEAILLRQMLSKSLGSLMGGENSTAGSVYGYLLTDVFAQKIAQAGGIGLAKLIEQQLSPPKSALTAAQAGSDSGPAAADSLPAAGSGAAASSVSASASTQPIS